MFADLSQSLEGGDSILVGLICMDLGKEKHEEQGSAEQEQGKEERRSFFHPLVIVFEAVFSFCWQQDQENKDKKMTINKEREKILR